MPKKKNKKITAQIDPTDHIPTPSIPIMPAPSTSYWENTNTPCATQCSFAQQFATPFVISRKVYAKIAALMNAFPTQEWLGYIIQDDLDTQDLFIPPQTASATSVYNVQTPPDIQIIAVIHSHHSMGAFFSNMDRDTVNINHDVSIVVSYKRNSSSLEFKAVRKLTLPCGMFTNVEIPVEIEPEQVSQQWLEEAIKNIQKPTPITNILSSLSPLSLAEEPAPPAQRGEPPFPALS